MHVYFFKFFFSKRFLIAEEKSHNLCAHMVSSENSETTSTLFFCPSIIRHELNSNNNHKCFVDLILALPNNLLSYLLAKR